MYKRVSHNIQEEHYGVVPPSAGSIDIPAQPFTGPLPTFVINESTLTFRMDSRTIWTKFALGLVNLSVARQGKLDSAGQVEGRLIKAASSIGDFFVPYYGMTAGYKIGALLAAYARIGIDTIHTVQNGKDLNQFRTLWISPINELADYLNELNPSNFPKELLVDMFTNLAAYWTDNIKARFASDESADAISLDNISKLVITGIPNHINRGYTSLADVLSRGVIAQFPLSFTV